MFIHRLLLIKAPSLIICWKSHSVVNQIVKYRKHINMFNFWKITPKKVSKFGFLHLSWESVEVALAARPTPPVWRWVSATAAARRICSRTPAARRVLAPARRSSRRFAVGFPRSRGKTHGKTHEKIVVNLCQDPAIICTYR